MGTATGCASLSAAAALIACGGGELVAAGPSGDEAAQRAEHLQAAQQCLAQEELRAAAELQRHALRQKELQNQLEDCCTAAERQQEGISAALTALARQLDCLLASGGGCGGSLPGRPPLLSLELPDSYAVACNSLLESLDAYVQHYLPDADSGGVSAMSCQLAAAQLHQGQRLELEQLQEGLCKGARLRVEEEAEISRLQAELEVLRAPSATTAASLGYSAADLDAEVATLQHRQAAILQQAQAAAEQAAAAAGGADVVEEQSQQRQATIQQRLQAKQQVAALLTQHLARQLLVRQLLLQEQEVLQQVHATAAAAHADAELALQATLERLPQAGTEHEQQQGQQQSAAGDAAAPSAAAATRPGDAGQASNADPMAIARQLLACRAHLRQLSSQLHSCALPAHRAVFAQLHALLYSDDDDSGGEAGKGQPPELTPAVVKEQLAAVDSVHDNFNMRVHAFMPEVMQRQAAPAERQLAEQVLVSFWTQPERLAALAVNQKKKLDNFTG